MDYKAFIISGSPKDFMEITQNSIKIFMIAINSTK